LNYDQRKSSLPGCGFPDQHPFVSTAWCESPFRLDAFALEHGEDTSGFSEIAPAEAVGPKHGEAIRLFG
jgi:hypothetical protein